MSFISYRLLPIILLVLTVNTSSADIARKESASLCQTNCVTPYGKVLGAAAGDVEAYSNCRPECKSYVPNKWKGTFTGVKWQCVEYARRWLLINKGAVYGEVDTAADIWNKVDHLTHVATRTKLPLEAHVNGAKIPPQPGDLLVYARAFYDTGHVAVVTHVDYENGVIEVAEQNYNNQPWAGDHARTIEFVKQGNSYWLLDGYLLGWKHIHNQADRRAAKEN
ncbi:MAG: CHAP domain-containing protein [Gammaproteobacteria bacterium]|jgi:glutathionylspermidine amidase/synthetase